MIRTFILIMAGALLILSFSPFNYFPLAYLCPALLCYYSFNTSLKKAFYNGLGFGLGLFIAGVYWIFISIHQFGNAPVIIALLVTGLFVFILALFYASIAFLQTLLSRYTFNALACLCVFPVVWTVFEWLRATLFTGFPWLFIGYSQMLSPLHYLAPLVGVYGLSFLVMVGSGSLVVIATAQRWSVKSIALVILLAPIAIGWGVRHVQWTHKQSRPLPVALLQGNIDQSIKWDQSAAVSILKNYLQLITEHQKYPLIVLPEGAFPVFQTSIQELLNKLAARAKKDHSNIVIGLPYVSKQNLYYNAMIMLGAHQGKYFKRHLVPFGEYTPFAAILDPLLKWISLPMSDFSKGPYNQPLFNIGTTKIAPFICYEIAYSSEVLQHTRGSGLIIVISDDSWYGDSIALNQQLQMTQMRALETGRPVLAINNTGITAIINPQGQIIKLLPIDSRAVLTGSIQPVQGNTPLMNYRYWPMWILCFFLMVLAMGIGRLFHTKRQ